MSLKTGYTVQVSPDQRLHCIEASPEDRFHCIEVSSEQVLLYRGAT